MVVLGGMCVVARGTCVVAPGGVRGCSGGVRGCSGGHAWLLRGGACMVAPGGACMVAWGGMFGCLGGHGCSRGACVVALGGTCVVAMGVCMVAPGGMRGCSGGTCMVAPRGACMVAPGGHAWLLRGGMRGFFDEIQSMSRRYASYWNAYLLQKSCDLFRARNFKTSSYKLSIWIINETEMLTCCTFSVADPGLSTLNENCMKTRMHSSRMRTVRSSSRLLGGLSASVHAGIQSPILGPGHPPDLGVDTPWADTPGLGLDTSPVNRKTDRCKNITFQLCLRKVIKEIGPRWRVRASAPPTRFSDTPLW